MFSLISYLLLTWFLGIAFFPLCKRALPHMSSAAYSLSKVFGVGLFFYIIWLFNHIEIFCGPWTSALILMSILLIFIKYLCKDYSSFVKEHKREVALVELLFFGVFFLVLIIYANHPELYWGEKPMDFSLLNYFSRYPTLPPEDPWFSGQTMHYYYWGYFYLAQLANMVGLNPEVSYGAGLALTSALLSCALYSIFCFFLKRVGLRVLGSLLLILSANVAPLINLLGKTVKFDMRYFWSSTRVFAGNGFAEYPSWSFLFADLHAHVMSYPFAMSFLALLLYGLKYIWKDFRLKRDRFFFILYAFSFSLLLLINGWDFVIYSVLASILWLLQAPKYWKRINYGLSFFFAHLLGLVIASPIFLTLLGGGEKKVLLSSFEMNGWYSLFLFFGGWFLILLMSTPYLFNKRKIENKCFVLPYSSLVMASVLFILIAENIIFMDRSNTIFKTYTNVFIWLGIAAIGQVFFMIEEKVKTTLFIPIGIILFSLLVGSGLNTYSILEYSKNHGNGGTGLKGSAYLKRTHFEYFQIIDWLRENTVGLPHLLEKDSPSFSHSYSLVSSHTGLPSYLGWHNHVRLRGAGHSSIEKRRSMIGYLYGSYEVIKVFEKLREVGIKFIVLGKMERREMDRRGLAKFESYPDFFKPLLKVNNRVVLYGVGDYRSYLRSTKIVEKDVNE